MPKREEPYRNQSALPGIPMPAKPTAERVPAPRPIFADVSEMQAYRDAVAATERAAGESLEDWLARVAARAKGVII